MDQQVQQAMDGSPAVVAKMLADLETGGKFALLSIPGSREEVVIRIKFQCGPIGEVGVNGCSIEDVIDVLVARLDGFQRGPFKCPENKMALNMLLGARGWLQERTLLRQTQGVEGTNAPHQS